jgi:hypothetical protein
LPGGKARPAPSAAAQSHFNDLCDLLGVDKPGTLDYEFEKSTRLLALNLERAAAGR